MRKNAAKVFIRSGSNYKSPNIDGCAESSPKAFKPEIAETFSAARDKSKNRAVANQIHHRQNQNRFKKARLLQIRLPEARLAPVRNQMKGGRPA